MPTFPATTVDFFLAGLEAFMVRSGQGEHWGVTALWLDAAPDAALLQQGWQQVHARHSMLGARLRRRWRGWRLVWESDGPLVAPPIVWHTAGVPVEKQLIQERLQGRASGTRLVGPLWLEVFPTAAGQKHLVLLTWRHALMDGTGVNLLLEKLAVGHCEEPPQVQEPKKASARLQYQKAQPLIQRLHEMACTGALSAWRQGLPQVGEPGYELIEFSAEHSAQIFERLRSSCGEFFQMPFYAAVAVRALRELHQIRGWKSPEIHLQLPIQSRGRSRDLIFGNHMGTLPLFLDAESMTSFCATVEQLQSKYKEAIKNGMPQASEAMMSFAWNLPVAAFIPGVRQTNCGQICSLFHSHTGTFLSGKTVFAGASVHNICTIPSVCAPPGLGIFVSDFAGRITVVLAWRGSVLTDREIHQIKDRIRSDLLKSS